MNAVGGTDTRRYNHVEEITVINTSLRENKDIYRDSLDHERDKNVIRLLSLNINGLGRKN